MWGPLHVHHHRANVVSMRSQHLAMHQVHQDTRSRKVKTASLRAASDTQAVSPW